MEGELWIGFREHYRRKKLFPNTVLNSTFEQLTAVENLLPTHTLGAGKRNTFWVSLPHFQPGFLLRRLAIPNKGKMKHLLYCKLRVIFGVLFDSGSKGPSGEEVSWAKAA